VAASAAFSHHAQRLLSSSNPKQVCAVTAAAISRRTGLTATVVEQAGQLTFADPADEPAARWALAHRDAAGNGAKVMPGARAFYVASRAGHRALLARLDGAAPGALDMVRGFLDDAADTLDRIELAARLEADTREADATAMREALFASIGHDVRTPLASLRAGLEALDGPSARLDPVRADALRLQRTFENLLELARLQATKAVPAPVSIDLTDTVASALDALPAPTRDRIEVQIAADTPLVSSDAVMLHHIVVNLIENAAKYSPADSPIQLSLQPDGAGGARLALADRGSGVGADVSDLFTLFRRGRHADSAPGSGVGLSVVDAFARALGHSVSARDRADGPGAIFVLGLAAGNGGGSPA
jgi:two-component system sensor histidine kinase KdpD